LIVSVDELEFVGEEEDLFHDCSTSSFKFYKLGLTILTDFDFDLSITSISFSSVSLVLS
jgi:hypothetical protein